MSPKSRREGPRLGAHMSIGGGMPRAIERAAQVEAKALQVFVKSSRQWKAKPLEAAEIESFREAARENDLAAHIVAHATYLINLASPDDALWRRSVEAFVVEMDRCGQLGIPYLVVHPGSHVGSGEEAGLARVARGLTEILEKDTSRTVTVLLEVTAGQGTNLGHRFSHLGQVIGQCGASERLGVCFDTCHALAAGYDFRGDDGYAATLAEFEREIGLDRLRAFHLNDSKFGVGSRKDRHEHIGKGEVGLEGFRKILNDTRFWDLPMLLETPKGDDLAEDRENLSVLRGLVRSGR